MSEQHELVHLAHRLIQNWNDGTICWKSVLSSTSYLCSLLPPLADIQIRGIKLLCPQSKKPPKLTFALEQISVNCSRVAPIQHCNFNFNHVYITFLLLLLNSKLLAVSCSNLAFVLPCFKYTTLILTFYRKQRMKNWWASTLKRTRQVPYNVRRKATKALPNKQ